MVDKGKLIELVRERVTLWDQREKQYHNRDLRAQQWEEIGKQLNIEGDEARKSWELVRDMFRKKIRETKGVSGSAAKTKWVYFDALSFLLPMMKPRRTSSNLPVSDAPTTQNSEEFVEVSCTENDLDFPSEHDEHLDDPEEVTEVGYARQPGNTSSTSVTATKGSKVQRPGSKRTLVPSITNEALNLERRKVQLLEARFAAPQTSPAEEDDDLSFFKSLLPSLKQLPHLQRMKLRSTILNCVIAELETGQTNRPWPSPTGTFSTQSPRYFAASSATSSPIPSPYHQNPGQGEPHTFSKNSRSMSHSESWPSPNNQMELLSPPANPYPTTFENI